MEHRPALKFCVLLSAGIVAGSILPFAPGLFFLSAAALFLAAIVVLIAPWGKADRGAFLFPVLVVSFGAFLASVDLHTVAPDDPAAFISPDTVTVTGSIAETAGRGPRSARFILECESASARGVTRELSGRVLVVLTGRAAEEAAAPGRLAPGRVAVVRGPILGIEPPRNPGDVDWQAHYRLSGIRARMPVRSPGQVSTGAVSGEGFVNRFVVPARAALARRIAAFIDDREARFLNGLVLGERNEVPSDLRADFITVGVMHLLAISGQQVVLVAMLIAGLLAVFRIPEKPRFIVVACALAYYVLLTGASPSVTRAGIMSVVMLGARVAQRKADIFNALGVAASAILLWDPAQLFDPGFLLSFSAVLAIVLLYPLVLRAAPGLTARCERYRVLDLAWKGTAVSLAAGLGTAPIVAYFFGRISLVGFLANILIVPLSSVALVLGLLTLGASFVWDWLASVYGAAAELSAWLTFRLVGFFADLPYASVDFRLSLGVLASVYVLLALTLVSAARKSWKPALFGLLVLGNVAVYAGLLSRSDGDRLRVTFLDVGQGDAAFVEFPGGATMIIDAGPKGSFFDAGERTVVPFLRHRGVDTVDYLVVSHPHGDHLGGVPAVMSAVPVRAVIEGGPAGEGAINDRFSFLADSLGVPRLRMSAGDVVGRDLPARVYVLGPDPAASAGSDNLNESSVVLMIRYGTTSVIFPGDAEEGLEGAMVARYGRFLDSDILKAGHHGSATSSSGPFVRDVGPAWTVISAGEGNRFGHPAPTVLERLASFGSAVHRTDRSGAAVFESDGAVWTNVDWRR
jgi:competence protein ComEC